MRGNWGWDHGGEKAHRTGESASVKLLAAWATRAGKAQNAGPTESALLWNTRKLEPHATQGPLPPYRAAGSLSSVDGKSTHAREWGKPNVARTLRVLPAQAGDICLQRPSLPAAGLNQRTWTRDHSRPPVSGWKLDTEETGKQKPNKQREPLHKRPVQQIKIPVGNTDYTGRGL